VIGAAGWFAFPRALFESSAWTTAPCATWRVWTWCAASAGYQPTVWHDGTTAVEIPAGAFVVSRQRLAAACRVTDKQARRAIAFLEAGGLIRTTVSPNRWTMITVLDSTVYGQQGPAEGPKETKGQQKGQPPDTPNPPVIPSNERTCADDPETKGQPKGQPKGHNKTIEQENNPGGGENPSFVDATARAAVPPPFPQSQSQLPQPGPGRLSSWCATWPRYIRGRRGLASPSRMRRRRLPVPARATHRGGATGCGRRMARGSRHDHGGGE
jgi:hypothetical protein